MKMQTTHKGALILTIAVGTALTGCRFDKVAEKEPPLPDLSEEENLPTMAMEDIETENPHKDLPMDFGHAAESARENRSFPGPFRIAADNIEMGRESGSTIPNLGAHGEAYLEMPHPDGSLLHIRGRHIRSYDGEVTVSGWPVVVRGGKRLYATQKDTVIKIGSRGVEALGPAEVEELVSSASFSAVDNNISTDPPAPFVPLPPAPVYEEKTAPKKDPVTTESSTTAGSDEPKRRGIINGKPLNRPEKRGFSGTYPGTDNPKIPSDASLSIEIDKSPSSASADFGLGNVPPLPPVPKP